MSQAVECGSPENPHLARTDVLSWACGSECQEFPTRGCFWRKLSCEHCSYVYSHNPSLMRNHLHQLTGHPNNLSCAGLMPPKMQRHFMFTKPLGFWPWEGSFYASPFLAAQAAVTESSQLTEKWYALLCRDDPHLWSPWTVTEKLNLEGGQQSGRRWEPVCTGESTWVELSLPTQALEAQDGAVCGDLSWLTVDQVVASYSPSLSSWRSTAPCRVTSLGLWC